MKLPEINITHGIHTDDGPGSFHNYMNDQFAKRGIHANAIFYGEIWAIQTRFVNPGIAEKLCDTVPDNSILIGHSNAGSVFWEMDQLGKPMDGYVLVNPALDRNKYIKNARWVHVYHNKFDRTVTMANIFRFNHTFGDQGRYGPDMTNWPDEVKAIYAYGERVYDTADPKDGLPDAVKHSWFRNEYGDEWSNIIIDNVIEEY